MNLTGADMQLQEMRDRLAAVTAERDALSLELSHLRPEWQSMQQERDAAVSALALATNSTPGKGTGVWVPLDKWTELQAQLAAATSERDAAVNHAQRAEIKLTNAWPRFDIMQLMQDVDDIIGGLDISNTAGAINWGDLGAAEAQIVWTEHYTWHYRVIIEEAEEECRALIDNVLAGLTARQWVGVEIETRW